MDWKFELAFTIDKKNNAIWSSCNGAIQYFFDKATLEPSVLRDAF